MSASLVGRAEELRRISELFVAEEVPVVVTVLGDAGVGKSRLLSEAAATFDGTTFRIAGYESERLVPLAAASELLRSLTSVPEHGPVLDELAFRSPSSAAPVRVFEAAYRALANVRRALVVLDDLQWADDLSLALVHYVLRAARADGGDLRLLTAGRSVARSIRFSDETVELLPPSQSARIDLQPLAAADAVELALLLDPRLSRAQAAALCERCDCVPFWIETLVRSGDPVSESRRVLTTRLRHAGPDGAALLAVLAVVARPLSLEDAAELLGWPPERLDGAADDLVSHGLAAYAEGRLRCAHDLLREAATDQLPAPRLRRLHGRVAAWLEEGSGDDLSLLVEALEHRAAAAEAPAELADRLLASRQRRQVGVEGLAVLASVADEAGWATAAAQRRHAAVAALALELGEHSLALERWRAVAPLLGDRAARFEALLGASQAAHALGWERATEAHRFVAEALACARTEQERIAATAHRARIVLWLDHDTATGASLARDALVRSRKLGAGQRQRRVRLQALRTAHEAAMQQADGEQIFRLGEEMVELVRGRDEDDYVDALYVRADGLARTAPLRAAEESARSALALARRNVLPNQEAELSQFVAIVLHEQARLVEAEELAAASRVLEDRIDTFRPARLIVHEIALARGGGDAALAEYLAEIDRKPDPHPRVIPRHQAAIFLARAYGEDARDEVTRLVAQATDDALAAGCPRCANELHVIAATALARVGSLAAAEARLEQAATMPPRDAVNRFLRLHAQGAVLAARDPAAGTAVLEKASAEASRLDRRLQLLWTRIDLARAVAVSDRPVAAEILRETASAADAAGAVVVALAADRQLRRLGVRTWRRGPTSAAGRLSAPERKVAELVASGSTNPEIAQALFLSRRTVERHVSNVMAKLGVRNRVELAAALAREKTGGAPP